MVELLRMVNALVALGVGFWWVIGGFPLEYYSPPTFIPIAVVAVVYLFAVEWASAKLND
jgi:hypothetical protein